MSSVTKLAAALFAVSLAFGVQAAERIVVQYSDRALSSDIQPTQVVQSSSLIASLVSNVTSVVDASVKVVRSFGGRALILEVADGTFETYKSRLESDPAIDWVELDRPISVRAQSPAVGLFNSVSSSRTIRSWHHQPVALQPAGMNTADMWDVTHGTVGSVVAVLDTGVLPGHPLLQGHLLPGYDFVSDAFAGNDGQSSVNSDRDNDPTDPGDGSTALDLLNGGLCSLVSTSTWHGTFVAGLIAGNPNVGEGIFPVGWNNQVLPVRVLGRCGGFSTDLADAIRWAAGLPVSGVPSNPFPASVINMSLGAQGACVGAIEGSAISSARNAGAIVVVAVGNDGGTVDTPANCPGVVAVAATDQQGLKGSYSNFGPSVTITAPGGDSAYPLWSAGNSGVAGPTANTYRAKIGSSFSSALVSAALGQALSVSSVSGDALVAALKATARPFLDSSVPSCQVGTNRTACRCTSSTCGVGMLDAGALVRRVQSSSVNLFSNEGSALNAGSSRIFTALSSSRETPVFQISNVVYQNGGSKAPTVSASGNQAVVTLPAGVESFLLRASVASGASAVAPVVLADSQFLLPSLVFGVFDTVVGIVTLSLGNSAVVGPVTATSGNGGDSTSANQSANVVSSGSAGGGGGLLSFFLLPLFCLLRAYRG